MTFPEGLFTKSFISNLPKHLLTSCNFAWTSKCLSLLMITVNSFIYQCCCCSSLFHSAVQVCPLDHQETHVCSFWLFRTHRWFGPTILHHFVTCKIIVKEKLVVFALYVSGQIGDDINIQVHFLMQPLPVQNKYWSLSGMLFQNHNASRLWCLSWWVWLGGIVCKSTSIHSYCFACTDVSGQQSSINLSLVK